MGLMKHFKPDGLLTLYRGFLPFLAFSTLGAAYIPQVLSAEAKSSKINMLEADFDRKLDEFKALGSGNWEQSWHGKL